MTHGPARFALIGLFFAIGCQSPTPSTPPTADLPPAGFHRVNEPAWSIAVGERYRLNRPAKINGQLVDTDVSLCGLRDPASTEANPTWLLKPEYSMLVGQEPFLFARRLGDKKLIQFDYVNGVPSNPRSTSYNNVWLRKLRNDGPERWQCVDDDAHVVSVLDAKGNVEQKIESIDPHSHDLKLELLPSQHAYVLHGNGFDRIYDLIGVPMSPELPPLWKAFPMPLDRDKDETKKWNTVYGACIDAKRNFYWLIMDDGRISPKPDDCLGLQPIIDTSYLNIPYWAGWLVWWKTSAGERCAFIKVDSATNSFETLMATRAQAKWSAYTVFYDRSWDKFDHIRCAEPGSRFEVAIGGGAVTKQSFASAEAALKYADDERLAADERAFQLAQRQEEQRKRDQEAEMRARTDRAWAERVAAQRAADQANAAVVQTGQDFDAALSRGDQKAARMYLLKLSKDPDRWTSYIRKWGLDPSNDNTSDSVGYARAILGGADADVLNAAVKASQPAAASAPQSDWDYFWNGPRDGSYTPSQHEGYQVDQRLVGQGFIDHQESIRRQNADAWLRGAQNWGATK